VQLESAMLAAREEEDEQHAAWRIAELIDRREDTNGRSPPTRPVVGAAVDVGLGEGFRTRCDAEETA
jgi:hypothetical protein